jgi:uncharacterized protein Smg (DUF494 family)
MRNRILEIVVLLIDYFRENQDHFMNIEDLSSSLKARGYTENEISSAYTWLVERYDAAPDKHFSEFPTMPTSNRVLTDSERRQLSLEAHGMLIKLLSLSLVDNEQFEAILERATMVTSLPVTIEQLKLIASSVIFRDTEEIDRITMLDMGDDPASYLN